MAQLDTITQHALGVALQVRAGAHHVARAVVAIVLDVAVIALGFVVVQGVVHAGAVAELVVEHRAQPAHTLLVAAIGDVVVLEAAAVVDLHGVAPGQDRRAPVRAVFLVLLVLHGEGVGEIGGEVAEHGEGQAVGLAPVAVDIAIALAATEVQAGEVTGVGGVAGQGLVDAEGVLGVVVAAIADAPVDGLLVTAGQLGDVVDRTAHGACAVQERRRAPQQLDTVDHPGVDRAGGTAVTQVDAVVELGHLVLGEAPVGDETTVARVGRGVDAGHGVDHVLGVLGVALLDHPTVGNAYRGGGFPGSQAKPRAGADRLVQLHARGGFALTVDGGGREFDGRVLRPGTGAGGAHQEHQGGVADHVVFSTQGSWQGLTALANGHAWARRPRVRRTVRLRGKDEGKRGD